MPRDPRTHITPDAFSVAPDLLGYALATPSRRLLAILIDLALAALLARTGIGYLIAVAAALLAWRAIGGPAERLLAGRGRVVFRAASAILALVIVINVWDAAADRLRDLDQPEAPAAAGGEQASSELTEDVSIVLEDLGLSGVERAAFLVRFASQQMADGEAAAEQAAELGEWVRREVAPGAARDEFSAALAEAMDTAARVRFLRVLGGRANTAAESAAPGTPDSTARGAVDAAGNAAPAPGTTTESPQVQAAPADSPQVSAAPATADSTATAAQPDSIQQLAAANAQLSERNARLSSELEELREQDEQRPGFSGWLSRISDDLGLGFGWFALYFTAFTVLGRGQTPGKRLLGIKVLSLDNRPLGWWLAFERFGGYAASFSIGLLGFAQILWDRNRQALHDKGVGTVVVRLRKGQPFRIA